MIDYLLHSRTFLDSELIVENIGTAYIVALVLAGLGSGLLIARQLWHKSNKYIERLSAENLKLREADGQQIKVANVIDTAHDDKPKEKELLAPAAAPVFTNRGQTTSTPAPKFVVEPELKTNQPGRIFGTSETGANTATSDEGSEQRIVYIMDVSKSLTDPQLELCKSELTKALKKLPASAEYQVIFFSGATWFAHQRMISGGEQGERVVIEDGDAQMVWKAGFGDFRYEEGNHNLPTGHWRKATGENIEETLEDISQVNQSFGTSWHLPFMLAMNLGPSPPTEIFFLTDGETAHQDLVAEGIVDMVKSKSSDTKINTRSLMVPNATEPLRHIAKQTSGEYLLIDLTTV